MILLFVEERQNAPSDLDSLTAQQLDEKFKEIMMKKRGTSVYIYTDNYSCYHFVCSHLPVVVHRGVFTNHLYMYCRVTLIKKIKVLDFTLYIIAVKYSIVGSILIINTCKLTLKLISPPPPNCIVTLLVIPYYIYYLSKLFNPWILLWDCYTEKCTEGNKISVKPKF